MPKRWLPDNVSRYRDRHKRWRYRYRKGGFDHTFKHEPGTEEFRAELRACVEREPTSISTKARPGSVADLVRQYCSVPSRLGPSAVTQGKVRSVVEKFAAEHGHRLVADFRFEHIDAIIAAKTVKVKVGIRNEGGISAARKLRKELVRLFAFAKKKRMRLDNPVEDAERVRVSAGERTKGFHSWTEDEIAAYRKRHPLGTTARLALELMLWTAQRRSDARDFKRTDIVDGRIEVTQGKTGKTLWIALAPQVVEAIAAMPPTYRDHLIISKRGERYSRAGFGNKMRQWCDEAGLPQCTAHGLRKAAMRRLAGLHLGNQTLKAISGHSEDGEVARYTRDAAQRDMADEAIRQVSEWERGRETGGEVSNRSKADV